MEDRYAFLAEWYDPTASLLRRYQLFFFPRDGSVEMFDVKNQRIFLRRTRYEDLNQEDLFVGNRVNVFSRQLHLVDYGDQYTANQLGSRKERTLALIKPDMVNRVGDVLERICSSKLLVTNAKMTTLSWKQAADFYVEHQSKPSSNLVQFASSGPVVALELMGDEAVSVWRTLLGPADSSAARKEAPLSVRAQFGTDSLKNVGHGSESLAAAARELEFFFPSTAGHGPANTAVYGDCTCCIIKPHALAEGLSGKILNSISEAGFHISALQMVRQSLQSPPETPRVYRGFLSQMMVRELSSGPCMVLEVQGAVQSFRRFCGPADPEVARHLRPASLRALYGDDRVKNGVHCTDLPEDGLLEVQYFFRILDG
ncbi:nucleoside diphosphate kinase 7 [Pseudoliparis swirei]|uniref:nucleoside diphosphate kinase 7 n=1 Tax=Pseudoliparis swirei TaxID=2059687 RepID=UPI0024BEC01E|nr:nucleoside diphosphate kinase 7 [Pseudoliparis swirei]